MICLFARASTAVTHQTLTIQMILLELRFYPRRLELSGNSFDSSPGFNEEVWKHAGQIARGTANVFAMRNLYPFAREVLAKRRNKNTVILNTLFY